MSKKKTYFKLYGGDKLSAMITEGTINQLEGLLNDAKAAYEEAKKNTPEGQKPRAGYIRLYPISEDKIQEWNLPEGTQNLVVVTGAEIESRKKNTSTVRF